MNPYAGDPTNFPTTIPVLDDGDDAEAATLAPALEGLKDAVAFLKRSASVPGDTLQLPMLPVYNASDRFVYAWLTGYGSGWRQDSVASAGALVFEIPPDIRYFEFSAIDVRVDGGTGRAGFTFTKPKVHLYRQLDIGDGSDPALVASVTDPSVDLAAYEQPHTITLALGGTEIVDHNQDAVSGFPYIRHWILIEGEVGAQASAAKLLIEAIILS